MVLAAIKFVFAEDLPDLSIVFQQGKSVHHKGCGIRLILYFGPCLTKGSSFKITESKGQMRMKRMFVNAIDLQGYFAEFTKPFLQQVEGIIF